RDLLAGQTLQVSAGARALLNPPGGAQIFFCCPSVRMDGQIVAYEAGVWSAVNLMPPVNGVILRFDAQSMTNLGVNTNALNVAFGSELSFRAFEMTPDGESIAVTANLRNAANPQNSYGVNTAVELWSALAGSNIFVSVNLSNTVPALVVSEDPAVD